MSKIVLNPAVGLAAQSLATSANFTIPDPFAYYGFAIQIKIRKIAGIIGSLKTQVSNDGVIWFDYTQGTFATTSISDDIDILFFVANQTMPFKNMRLVYTRTSGNGTLDAIVAGVRV